MDYERQLRKLRQKVFEYPPEKDAQVQRIFTLLKLKIELTNTAKQDYDFQISPMLNYLPDCPVCGLSLYTAQSFKRGPRFIEMFKFTHARPTKRNYTCITSKRELLEILKRKESFEKHGSTGQRRPCNSNSKKAAHEQEQQDGLCI